MGRMCARQSRLPLRLSDAGKSAAYPLTEEELGGIVINAVCGGSCALVGLPVWQNLERAREPGYTVGPEERIGLIVHPLSLSMTVLDAWSPLSSISGPGFQYGGRSFIAEETGAGP